MAIVNRSKDASEQKHVLTANHGALATGVSAVVGIVPFPAEVSKIVVGALGLSGAPTARLLVTRQVSGGMTILNTLMSLQAVANVAATLPTSMSFSSSFLLQANDVLTLETAVANTAVEKALVSVVLKKTQDVVSYYGSAT